jgi:tRNA (adenine57-N1/adenine58-N1)-methyltransferase catalytic subunit
VNEVDASVVTMMLDVFPGCKVVESGTGSGCMTLSLARAVYPNGHVYTYEYNKVRAETAREEFQRLKVDHLVTVTHRDVCGKYRDEEEGGGFSGVSDKSVDSVFLDLPEPWLAIGHAKKILKPGRHICCYSPCIEQVMKGCEKLRELGFHSIRMIEVRQRPYDARYVLYFAVSFVKYGCF